MSMRSLRRALAVGAVSVLALAACGDDESSDAGTEEHSHDEAAADGEHSHDEAATGSTVAATDDAVVIDIDADAAEPGTQTVPVGSTVSLHISGAESHEYHLHGYDIEQEGTDVTITFEATEAGSFEVETHDTEQVVFTLVVE